MYIQNMRFAGYIMHIRFTGYICERQGTDPCLQFSAPVSYYRFLETKDRPPVSGSVL